MELDEINKLMHERRDNSDKKHGTDIRKESERDLARIIHSAAFRRLQTKTQVLGLGESDFYRTRLTHSMEVSQVGVGILKYLERAPAQNIGKDHILGQLPKDILPSSSQLSAICLAHDIGHPPFGHGGEVALNYCMRGAGGFEGNGQTLKILAKLAKYRDQYGVNPTRRTLLGILKYPVKYSDTKFETWNKHELPEPNSNWLFKTNDYKPPKCYFDDDDDVVSGFIFEAFTDNDIKRFTTTIAKPKKHPVRKSVYQSLDTSIMTLADDISYGIHDLEDGISLNFIKRDEWKKHFEESKNEDVFDDYLKQTIEYSMTMLEDDLFSEESSKRKRAIGRLIHLMISTTEVTCDSNFESPLLQFNVKLHSTSRLLLDTFESIVRQEVIESCKVQQLEFKGQKMVFEMFQAIASDPKRFLPSNSMKRYEQAKGEIAQRRVISNFISGMTDDYAIRMYEKIFMPRKGSVFDHI